MQYTAHKYQDRATRHIIENPAAGLFLEMGLGKTVATLTAIDELVYQRLEVGKVLVVAPKRVTESTWSDEVEKWDHLKHLRVSVVLGTAKKRKAALREDADIYAINRENIPWLVGEYGLDWPFDMVVIDESTSFKNSQSARFKNLRKVLPLSTRKVILTGTPAPNKLVDLWAQLYILDQGERLGSHITKFRNQYFNPGHGSGHVVYEYKVKDKNTEGAISGKIADICISMKSADYLDLPERINQTVEVTVPPDVLERYKEFKKEKVLELLEESDDEVITAANAAALSNKLLQFANGAVYKEDKSYTEIHDGKLDALGDILEAANGRPVLCFYNFKSDVSRITERFSKYAPELIAGKESLRRWNDGKIQLLLAHPKSAGHGLNMQKGGNIAVFYGLTWSLEEYQQAGARLHRQGQTCVVTVYHLATLGTIDKKVLNALEGKASTQDALMDAVKAIVDEVKQETPAL